jgi:hypothetical protein
MSLDNYISGDDYSVIIRKSAFKHGITRDDILQILSYPVKVAKLEEDPNKWLYIGTGVSDRELEVITVEIYEDVEVVIHAMKLTKKYLKYLED